MLRLLSTFENVMVYCLLHDYYIAVNFICQAMKECFFLLLNIFVIYFLMSVFEFSLKK